MDSKTAQVFVIDDDLDLGNYVKLVLADVDVSVAVYEDPEHAWLELSEKNPRLILLDYLMPDCRGDEWMIRLSEHLKFGDHTVVLVTGYHFDEDFEFKLMTLGISEVLGKPLRANTLKDLVNRYVLA